MMSEIGKQRRDRVRNRNKSLPFPIPRSDPFKVFLSFLTNLRVATSHQELPKSSLDLALRTHVTNLIVLSVGLVTFIQVG